MTAARVSAMLGRASISTTLTCYAHLVPGLSEQGTAKLSALIWNDEETPPQDSEQASVTGESDLWASEWVSN